MRSSLTVVSVIALVACVIPLAACTSSVTGTAGPGAATPTVSFGGDPIAVVASTDVYGDLVSRIGGARVSVTSFISDPSQDPHSFQADARNQLSIRAARLVIENGGGYDDFMDTMLNAAPAEDRRVLNVVDLSGHHPPDGEELNEHAWYDFPTVDSLVDAVAAALSTFDPAHADSFRANASGLHSDLKRLEQREHAIEAKDGGRAVAITEPVPLYLLTACGLTNATSAAFSEAIEEGTDVPVAVLQQTLDLFNDHRVAALVYNEQTSGPQTQQVRDAALRNKIPVVGVSETLPAGMSYVQWMSRNLDDIEAALS